jgi:hypothetical protein
MGQLLMPATVFETVANQVSQLSQPQSTLRQCDSCPYPFRDRAPTVALSQRGCWSEKQSVADRRRLRRDAVPNGWGFKRGPKLTPGTAPVLNFTHWQNYIAEVEL